MRYRVILLNSWGSDSVEHYNSWIKAKLRMVWLNITGRRAIWMEKRFDGSG